MKKQRGMNDEKLILNFRNTGKTLEFVGINAKILGELFSEGNLEWLTAVSVKSKHKKIKKQKISQIKIYPNVT